VGHLEEKVAELSRANARLRELDAARTEFYRNISHELATPMTPIVGYVKLLADEELGPLNKSQKKALRALEDCVRRLRALIDNLLDVTGIETGRMRFMHTEYDFLDTTRRAIAQVADRFAEAKVQLVDELPRGPLPAWGDAGRLLRAMIQILDNAVKFTPAGGSAGVRVRVMPSGHYELCVADTGPGVSPDRLARIFESFYQVDGSTTRAYGGVGVGLAIARRTAQGLGGDIRVASPATRSSRASGLGAVHLGRARAPMHEGGALGRPADPFSPDPAGRAPMRGFAPESGPRIRAGAYADIYLDWNATTPLCAAALEAMRAAAELGFANPASGTGPEAGVALIDGPGGRGGPHGPRCADVTLTSGGTEATTWRSRTRSTSPRRRAGRWWSRDRSSS
jgi:hypothetical protein